MTMKLIAAAVCMGYQGRNTRYKFKEDSNGIRACTEHRTCGVRDFIVAQPVRSLVLEKMLCETGRKLLVLRRCQKS